MEPKRHRQDEDRNPRPEQEPERSAPALQDAAESGNEGEGSRSADADYRRSVASFVRSGQVERAAEEAARSVRGKEGEALRQAERDARSRGEH